jgi:hypothetical protein
MSERYLLLFPLLVLAFIGCQKKDVDIDFNQDVCDKLRINTPTYVMLKDPSCDNQTDSAVVKVVFRHPGQKQCIEKIFPVPVFYDSSQTEIKNVSYANVIEKSASDVRIYNDSASFILKTKFSSVADASRLNNIQLKFHTENLLGDKSKDAKLRINGKCLPEKTTTYKVRDTVEVSSEFVNVTFYDNQDEDGDIISVYLNGIWVLENIQLTNAGKTFSLQVKKGYNDMIVYAVNQGSSGPNTCAVSVNNSTKINMEQDMKTGDAVSIHFK